MSRLLSALLGIVLLGLAGFMLATAPQTVDINDYAGLNGDAAKGEQVFWATGCASCHAAPDASGAAELVLSGGQEFPSAFGTFLAPNISPDPTQGIGGWSLITFANAVTMGVGPEGAHLYPALPYGAYNKMLPQDVADLKAFMDGLPPSTEASKPHQIGFPFNIRRSLGIWKLLFLRDDWVIAGDLTPEQSRGRYIVEAMAHCGECHTPRNALGGLQRGNWLAGAPNPDGKGRTPNITPAKLKWTESEVVEYLTSGFTPDFDSVGGHMAHVVENMAKLPEEDRKAVAAYLQLVPEVQ
ncbi:diheme cytochrome c-type [Cypionkella aquatica]|uniref:Diheme cytochrome c-type n=1 Tax=Cypionkella aquatica TaxID=1756042 RepID=A0AA37TZI0_9RHOB|nr:c-type cytochrome [Cypionkella aquatica]GLS85120.1 diheme cytochrome c-type [Cypionkella aquatica]